MAVLVVIAACMPMQPRTPPGGAPSAVQIGKDGAPMALVPAGEFTMGGDGLEYPWGNEAPTSRHANFNKCCDWKGYDLLATVGSLEAGRSPYAIYDLAGNVSEWVADWYNSTSYKYELDRNPKGPTDGEEK